MRAWLHRHPLMKRLPLLVFAALGLWLWKSPLWPQARHIVWQPGAGAADIRRVDVQLYSPRGELLKRDVRELPSGAGADVVQDASLREGTYDARFVIDRAHGPQETGRRELKVAEGDTYVLSLGRR